MSGRKKYKVSVIEPSPVIREGIRAVLEKDPGFIVTESHPDLRCFQEANGRQKTDLVLINPATISFYKPFAVRELFPELPEAVIVAIVYSYVDADILGGFDGVLDIYDEDQVMVKKLHRIVQSGSDKQAGTTGESVELSDREKEILVSVASGLTNKEIADKHFISIHTVISHRKNITKKTGIKTVSGLTLYAMFNNLISPEDLLGDE